MRSITGLAVAWLVTVGLTACNPSGPPPSPDPHDSDGPGALAIELAAPEEIRGTFRRADLTLRFHGARTDTQASLIVLTGAGEELFAIEGTATGSLVRMSGQEFLRSGDRASANVTTDPEPDAGVGDEQCTGTPESGEAYVAFLGTPEAALLPWLSAALGELGYDGRRYPSTMLLHKLGMRVAADTDITPPMEIAAAATETCDATAEAAACADISADPNKDQCYGMCGKGCSCWKWVCGDCCCNVGCRTHDSHCRACTADPKRNWRDCIQCACFDWGNPLFDCRKCS